MQWEEKLMKQLDNDLPFWEFKWASQSELLDYSVPTAWHKGTRCLEQLRASVARRLFHTVLHAAIGAGIVKESSNANS